MLTELVEVTCPKCGMRFAVPVPPVEEVPSMVDYDCEICCGPMVIEFTSAVSAAGESWDEEAQDIAALAHSLVE